MRITDAMWKKMEEDDRKHTMESQAKFKELGCEPNPCPWCGEQCHDLETMNQGGGFLPVAEIEDSKEIDLKYRIGSGCDKSFETGQKIGDATGNDWGRSNWFGTIKEAVDEWNEMAEEGKKTNQLGVW